MYQFNGWFAVSDDPYESESARMKEIAAELEGVVGRVDWPNGFAAVRWLGGSCFLHVAGAANRPAGYREELHDVVTFLAEQAPGTYGVLYSRDDEDPDIEYRNAFRVLVLAKGEAQWRDDPFLSPIVPTIED